MTQEQIRELVREEIRTMEVTIDVDYLDDGLFVTLRLAGEEFSRCWIGLPNRED
jgi:hypothetical protein